jgi:hypothetical protein
MMIGWTLDYSEFVLELGIHEPDEMMTERVA